MSNKQTKPLAPKLRFPDFQGSSSWQIRTLGQACHMQAGKFVPAAEIHDKYMQGLFPCYGGNGLRGYTATFTHNGEYSLIGRQGALCGNIKQGIGQFHATEHAIVVTPKNGTTGDWLFFVLDLMNLNRFATGQAQPGLSVDVLEKLPIAVPNEEAEQQKIADCLSSLDELIAAQARKVEALKTHKKGLMQQLFPREGDTQPRLRFPEFQNADEWEETRLEKLGKLISGLTYSPDDVRDSGLLVLRSSNVQNGEIALDDCVYVDPSIKGANLSQPEDILICVRNGSKALIGKCALIPQGMPLCTHGAFMTVYRADTPSFVFQLFQSDRYQKQVAGDLGATINSINGSQFLKYKFFVPKPAEQKRIADFLASLDTLITATTQELETLKTHKKGLMQQLFPSAEAVEA